MAKKMSRVKKVKAQVSRNDWPAICGALEGELGVDQMSIAVQGMRLIDLVLSKNSDYGSCVFEPPILCPHLLSGEAIRVRMSDKISRLHSLWAEDLEPTPKVDESIEDTLKDLAGYIILWLSRP